MELNTLLNTAIRAAFEAGKEILVVYDQPVTVEFKDDKSPLTLADKKAHTVIATTLAETDLPVLSEEGKHLDYSERSKWDYFWMVDPLDGTKEFIKRNGEFTVNIALIEKSKPVLGVIYAPVLDTLYFSNEEIGAYKCAYASSLIDGVDDLKLLETLIENSSLLTADNHPQVFTVVASRSHLTPETEQLIEKFKKDHGTIETISKGSSLKLCLVAEGAAHVYPRLAPTMEWDTAAGQAIAEHSGHHVHVFNTGKPMQYNKENLLNDWFIVQ